MLHHSHRTPAHTALLQRTLIGEIDFKIDPKCSVWFKSECLPYHRFAIMALWPNCSCTAAALALLEDGSVS